MKKRNFIYMCFILPSFIGIMAFYIVPFLLSLYFAVIDNMMNKEWVGLKNFKLLFENELFLSALRNTGIFCGIAIPLGMAIVLFWSGINWIPQIYHEQCQLDGATGRQEFQYITWILLKPTTLVVLLMSIVNSFKVFKEIYMLYGAYPSPYVYMLQHYMNNQFLSLNMQKLSAAAWCMFLILGIFLGIIYRVQRKNLDYL